MVTHQGCPQTPGRRRGPIPAMCQYQGSPVSYHRTLVSIHQGPGMGALKWAVSQSRSYQIKERPIKISLADMCYGLDCEQA